MNSANDIRYPSIDGLRAFEAAARLGSFERAADELNVTAGAIGKRIATLEELLGASLFTRGAKPLGLTATGKEYLVQVDAALKMFAAVPLHRRAAQQTQRLRLTAPPTFARQILVPRLADFRRCHEGIEVAVELAIPLHDLQPAGIDVEIRFGRGLYPEFVTLNLLDEAVFPVCAPSYAKRVTLSAPPDLEHATLLRSALEPWAPWFAAAGLRWPEPASGPRYEDLAMLYQAASDGEGVALARPSLVAPALDSGALQRVFEVAARSPHAYYLVCRPAVLVRPEVAQFVDWLRASLPAQRAR